MIITEKEITLDVVEGHIEFESSCVVKAANGERIIIKGNVEAYSKVDFQCSLECEEIDVAGSMSVEKDLQANSIDVGTHLHVGGNLTVNQDIDVGGHLKVIGRLQAADIDIGGSVDIGGHVTVTHTIDIGGHANFMEDVQANDVDIGGSISVKGFLNCKEIDIGGKVTVGGANIKFIDVGGSLEVSTTMEFEDMDIGGKFVCKGDATGKTIDVGGSVTVEGDLKVDDLDVGAKLVVNGSLEATELDVGGIIYVKTNLTVKETVNIGGKIQVDGTATAKEFLIGGKGHANQFIAQEVQVGGKISSNLGVICEDFFKLGNNGKASGPIVADEVVIGRQAKVEDVWGVDVTLKSYAQANNVYAKRITLNKGVEVFESIKYTDEIVGTKDALLHEEPEQVTELPTQPNPTRKTDM